MTEKGIKWASFFIASPIIVVITIVNALLIRWGLVWWQILIVILLSLISGMWLMLVLTSESEMLKENGYEQK